MVETTLFMILSFGWYVKSLDGSNVYVLIKGNEFRLTEGNIQTLSPLPELIFISGRFSKLFLTKQDIYEPLKYKEMIIDEETKVGIYKESITLFYGKIYLDVGEVGKDSEIIRFYGTPYFVRLVGGKIIIFSADSGYFLYCSKCVGDIWRQKDSQRLETEAGASVRDLLPASIFFLDDNDVSSEFVDEELLSLLKELENRIKRKGKFAREIFYSYTSEVPQPVLPDKKRFKLPRTELDSSRQSVLLETVCYILLKVGRRCDIRR